MVRLSRMQALDHAGNANADLANGRSAKAPAAYDQALTANPGTGDTCAGRAFPLHQIGRQHKALKCIDKALEIKPDSVRSLGVNALILARMKPYPSVLQSMNKAVELESREHKILPCKGRNPLETGQATPRAAGF